MGSQPHYFHAEDDTFIEAAGLDVNKYPEYVKLEDYLHDNNILIEEKLKSKLIESRFLRTHVRLTLSERFKLHGIYIVKKNSYFDEDPVVMLLSNGKILKEELNEQDAREEEKDGCYDPGYDFVFCYTDVVCSDVKDNPKGVIWCNFCQDEHEYTFETLNKDSMRCPMCNTKDVIISDIKIK